MDPVEARRHAHAAAMAIARDLPRLVTFDGLALDGALEQQLFFALRDGRRARGPLGAWAGELGAGARTMAALGASMRPRRLELPPRPIAVLVREPVHLEVLDRVGSDLAALGAPPIVALLTGRAETAPLPAARPPVARLRHLLDPRALARVPAWQARAAVAAGSLRAALRAPEVGADTAMVELLVATALEELPRIGMAAAILDGAVGRLHPVLLAAFDEVGTWARILPGVARRHGVGSLDIPHAEAADPEAIRGAAYDRMAVYGRRAAAIVRQAGIAPERIVEVGAPRFDALAAAAARAHEPPATRRLLFAAQYAAGALTDEVQRTTYAAALAAAAAVAPSELVVRPHPARPPMAVKAFMRDVPVPEGVTLRIESARSLQELLFEAWVLVTAWSNSVFEAALAGVPAITIVPAGVADPVDFAGEGLAIGARDEESVAQVARGLLDPAERRAAVDRARRGLEERIGPADGRASERVARLMQSMIGAP